MATTNFEQVRGTSIQETITVRVNGAPIDITGYTFYFTVKTTPDDVVDDSTALIQKTWTTHSNPTAGETILLVDAADTDIPKGTYFYDIQYKSPSGLVEGSGAKKFKILESATNRAA